MRIKRDNRRDRFFNPCTLNDSSNYFLVPNMQPVKISNGYDASLRGILPGKIFRQGMPFRRRMCHAKRH
jgi:hypothetical protein